MSAAETSPSEDIRSKLDDPVVDCDGHYIEFMPYFMDFVEDVGGTSMVETFRQNRSAKFACSLLPGTICPVSNASTNCGGGGRSMPCPRTTSKTEPLR